MLEVSRVEKAYVEYKKVYVLVFMNNKSGELEFQVYDGAVRNDEYGIALQKQYIENDRVFKFDKRGKLIRPIVRGKTRTLVEFGAKFDLSIDEDGYGRIERISFDAYNEGACLQEAAENYRKRTGHYPLRILADQIYRTRENRKFCKEKGICLSGPKPGRPGETAKEDRISG